MNRLPWALAFAAALLVACADSGEPTSTGTTALDDEFDLDDATAAGLNDDLLALAEDEPLGRGGSSVRLLTQNLYIGLDVFPIIVAPPDQVPFVVAEGFADLLANRPADRLAAVADEIALIQPHLIGLQEVMQIFTQFPADTVLGNTTPNATDEFIDFLAVLLDELAARGLDYEVAAERQGADVELPRFDGLGPDGAPLFTDVRSKFFDVILRRADVETTPLFAFNYAAALPIPNLPGTFVRRNAIAVTATVGVETFRLVSTHLEPLVPGLPDESQPQFGQVAELIQTLDSAFDPNRQTIVLGDFNSPAEAGRSYQAMTAAGYTDVWKERDFFDGPGFTCCQDVVLTHRDSRLFERIDLLWTKNTTLSDPVLAVTIGDLPFFRTRTRPRLWPSDHAGVAARLRF